MKPENQKKRVLIVDLMNMFIRAFVIVPTLDKHGLPSGGVYGTLKTLQKLCKLTKPDRVICVLDGTNGSKRKKKLYKGYKDGRGPVRLNRNIRTLTDEEEQQNKQHQLLKLIEYLNLFPVIQFCEENIEADDIIARVCKLRCLENDIKIIVSSDKDFFQLCADDVVVLRPTQEEIMTTKRIIEKFDIHPNNFVLARSMCGDPSDNLDGIKGVGIKTAAKRFAFLKEEKSYLFADLYSHCEENRGKAKIYEDVLMNKGKIELNYKISQLYTPNLSPQVSHKIKEVVETFIPSFNQTEVAKKMINDGMNEYSWDILFQTFKCMSAEYQEFKT